MYLIGDVQGCDGALDRLLAAIDFSPSRDTVYLLGDLVNRGPDSLGVLRRLRTLEGSAHALLGNHDLHLLAVAHGVRAPQRNDTLADVLNAPDAAELLAWLRQRPLALRAGAWTLVHAGMLPQWTSAQTVALAAEVQSVLASPDHGVLLHNMYGNTPNHWSEDWRDLSRWRLVINALTRLRFCDAQGVMEFATKDGAAQAPAGYMPWFDVPQRASAGEPVAFGHWSTLGLLHRSDLLSLDTGCVWGGHLTAARLHHDPQVVDITQVPCPQAQRPGSGAFTPPL
jgi:bis(5'-nucleosyl)-tetraphosphatase (symmetrical)